MPDIRHACLICSHTIRAQTRGKISARRRGELAGGLSSPSFLDDPLRSIAWRKSQSCRRYWEAKGQGAHHFFIPCAPLTGLVALLMVRPGLARDVCRLRPIPSPGASHEDQEFAQSLAQAPSQQPRGTPPRAPLRHQQDQPPVQGAPGLGSSLRSYCL